MPTYPTRVSYNHRFLQRENGEPFFYLGDTAWELFHRLDRDETELYFQDRISKKYSVIQAVVLAEEDGLRVPNRYDEVPLHDFDPTRPNEKYFEHVDWAIARANELGLCVGLLPTWGDKWNMKWGVGPKIFTPENAATYGEWLGRRYRDAGVIWIVGGDRPIENETHRAIVENTALGLRAGDGGRHLISFHPCGQQTSSQYFHQAEWLDFNMWQTGHGRDRDNYDSIARDYALSPTKPCMDAEPCYEEHPAGFKVENDYLREYDVRRALYWALFAGAHGHTYGCHAIWQFWDGKGEGKNHPVRSWQESLNLPGAGQMQHARALLESKPFFSRIPDQSIIIEGQSEGRTHLQATRDSEGSFALVYFPESTSATIDLRVMASAKVSASWFDPRTGESHTLGEFSGSSQEFTPPQQATGEDWVLVLDAG